MSRRLSTEPLHAEDFVTEPTGAWITTQDDISEVQRT